MGLIIARFRKKTSTLDELEDVDGQIKEIEEFRRNTETAQKYVVGRFVIISVVVYLVVAALFYFFFFPATLYQQIIYIIPLLFAPVIIVGVKRWLSWYFNRKLLKEQKKLVTLKDKKKKLIDNVMETETYKVAKDILDKFAPEQVRKVAPLTSELVTPKQSAMLPFNTNTGLRQRTFTGPRTSALPSRTPYNKLSDPITSEEQKREYVPMTPLPMARNILPSNRSVLDKLVDYLIGDGPSNRYALICKQCSGHNGMAIKEEFEYLSFTCCYCYTLNNAIKKRPAAPKLTFDSPTVDSDTSESEKLSPSDSDSEVVTKDNNAKVLSREEEGASDADRMSDFDKLSDLEHKHWDAEGVPMDVDQGESEKRPIENLGAELNDGV